MLDAGYKSHFISCAVLNSLSYSKLMPKDLGMPYFGKVRLVYDIPNSASQEHPLGTVLIVTTDNISSHNIIHDGAIPYKGYVLNTLSVWGFNILNEQKIPNHFITYGKDIYTHLDHLNIPRSDYPEDLHLRAVVCEKLEMVLVEFVFRENLCGGLYKDYLGRSDHYHLNLPPDLKLMHRFDQTIFTPTRKSKNDEPVPFKSIVEKYPDEYDLALKTWKIYLDAFSSRGLELVDGKLEIGLKMINDKLVPQIADEPPVTPDSIRLVKSGEVKIGTEPKWIGKENVRQLVEKTWKNIGCENKAIKIPGDVADSISNHSYQEPFFLITGLSLQDYWQQNHFWSKN